MPEFQKGDTVRLKSGGPLMTVAKVGDFSPIGPADGVHCEWFDGKRRENGVFDSAVLEKEEPGGFRSVPIERS